ncbi:GAF domain-containing protein [Kitasatospora sp. RB6PN24]|uniref:GAF domain-containing protein n=1 Tax=Kitasatospora humi TaxID=2893891 RepID=UPI001E3220E8|nr:GAF domain-containing protein [Kitasatospora humi]MCC9305760.1 GAF domain-containing protein [Kitasatospora humi]
MGDLTRIAQLMAAAVAGASSRFLPDRLCGAAVEAPAVDGSAIVLMTEAGHRAGVWAGDERVRRLEDRQFALGEGPTLDAFRTRRPVLVPDLPAPGELRWPVLSVALTSHGGVGGPRGAFALPLQLGESCTGNGSGPFPSGQRLITVITCSVRR